MSEPDKFDDEAAEMLPCVRADCQTLGHHFASCPAFYRPASAARLRADGLEIERLQEDIKIAKEQRAAYIGVIKGLKAQLAELHEVKGNTI
jgi:hypothetical protein